MSELYWITTLGNLSVVGIIMLIITMIIFVGAFTVFVDSKASGFENDAECAFKVMKHSLFPLIISLMMVVFIPSTKQLYVIYGVGSVIDYIKSNDKTKQLPDKAVEALTRYLDSIEKEEK